MAIATKSHHVISKIAHGWQDIEHMVVAMIAAKRPFMMQGLHGNSKTTVGKLIGYVYHEKDKPSTFRYYDCSKSNLISMAGFLDPSRMKEGEQAFIPNNKSLLGSDKYPVRVILLDEITRAPKDAGNQLLEVIEEKTIYGHPTGHEVLFATSNPHSYKGATKLDEALLDRFAVCIPIPSFKDDIAAGDIEKMIRINVGFAKDPKTMEKVGAELKKMVDKVSKKYNELIGSEDVVDRVSAYSAQVVEYLKNKWQNDEDAPYISTRSAAAQIWQVIVAVAAYQMVALGRDEKQAFAEASNEALKYGIITKLGMEDSYIKDVQTAHAEAKFLILNTAKGPAGKLGIAFAKANNPAAKIQFWKQSLAEVQKHCDAGMKAEMMSSTVEAIEDYAPRTKTQKDNYDNDKLGWQAELYGIAKSEKDFANVVDSLEGSLVCQLIVGLNNSDARLTDEPYSKTSLVKNKIDASDVTDAIVHILSSSGTTKKGGKKAIF